MDYIDIFIKNNYINLKQIAESLKNIFSSMLDKGVVKSIFSRDYS